VPDTMSRYLIQRITENPAIEMHYRTEITGIDGEAHLENVIWLDKQTGETSNHAIRHVFIMAGASPRTRDSFLPDGIWTGWKRPTAPRRGR
jgi:thioredoxin reductase (NADPH)